MELLSQRPRLSAEQRGALELLASFPRGVIEGLEVLAYRFDHDMIAGLVQTGVAIARREIVSTDVKPIEVNRIRITDAGRDALAPIRSGE
jgi:hypothetical protein